MGREIEISGVFIHAKRAACSHSCRYCLMGDKTLARFSTERLQRFILRFLEWGARRAVAVSYVVNYSDEYDRETLDMLATLNARFPSRYPLGALAFGGVKPRGETDMRAWLKERWRYGCRSAHATFAGTHAVHDGWNGRAGNFEVLMRGLRLAGEIGMARGARLLVARSTLASLEELNAHLDRLPRNPGDWRYAQPFFYLGWGARLEEERIDEDMRDALPGWLAPLMARSASSGRWRSEREWIAHLSATPEQPTRLELDIDLTDAAIDPLEHLGCDAIVAEYEARTRAAYAAIPSLHELAQRYGDRDGRRVYELQRCIEGKWLDRHLAAYPTSFERQRTHLDLS